MSRRLLAAVTLFLASTPAFARGSDGAGIFFFFVIGGIVAAFWIYSSAVKGGVERGLAERKSEIEAKAQKERALTTEHVAKQTAELKEQQDTLTRLIAALDSGYLKGRQWLADYIAEAFRAADEAAALGLEYKTHPAQKAADEVRRIAAEKKALPSRLKYLEYAIKTYHEYYPVLEQYSDDVLNETASLVLDDEDPDTDRVSRYISKEEYERLKPAERNQRALDNWKARNKSNVEIGRMYERYLGYLYEQDGWAVTFFGAIAGMEDMGRDLLCVKGSAVHVVQAKYWAKHKTIHEKHVFQLYGTTVMLPLTKPNLKGMRITPVFATTTKLSETAGWAAKILDVEVKNTDMDLAYPLIKCNVNGQSKIYHLPFDQQYDRVRIDLTRGERYAKTAAEAEKLGFRRAMRHTAYATASAS